MRAVVQRVHRAECRVEDDTTGSIEQGLLVFLGVGEPDDENDAETLARKVHGLRVFENNEGKMDRSVQEVQGGILVIPQFTLYGDVSRGLRPSFDRAAPPDRARRLYENFIDRLSSLHQPVRRGAFGKMMDIRADNDGPVTILIDTRDGG